MLHLSSNFYMIYRDRTQIEGDQRPSDLGEPEYTQDFKCDAYSLVDIIHVSFLRLV